MVLFYEDFFLNLCVLIASLFVYKQLSKESSIEKATGVGSIVQGLLGGFLGAILMHFSIETGTNSMIDLRIIPVMLVVLYGSWVSTSITASLIILFRFIKGINIHSFYNIFFILISCLAFYYCLKKVRNRWTSIAVMLTASNLVYMVLTILSSPSKEVNPILMLNYWIVCIIGGMVAVYIMDYLNESETLFKQNKNYAFTDPLTGLNNVRSFDEAFNKAKSRQLETSEYISIMLLDIDRFKQVNDTYGHLEGDAVLRKLAAILKMSQGPNDIVSRNGGEEFTVLLYDCNLKEAYERAESLRKIVENSFFTIKNGTLSIYITISIGVTTYGETTMEIDQLYDHADQALYAAKKSGRNKVCSYSQVVESLSS